MANLTRLLPPISLFILTLASGMWLSRLGRPYRPFLFNSHELVALRSVVLFGIQINQTLKSGGISVLSWTLVELIILAVIAMFASGSLLSAGDRARSTMLIVRRVGLVSLLVSAAALVWILIQGLL